MIVLQIVPDTFQKNPKILTTNDVIVEDKVQSDMFADDPNFSEEQW